MLAIIDLLFPGWVLALADAVVMAIVGLPAYLAIRRFTSSETPAGRALRMVGWVVPCLVALQFRGHYGPAFRLALMRSENRPARRFADRIARSAEIRAYREKSSFASLEWISEQGGFRHPRFLAAHVAERGLLRLSDREIMLRNDILSRAIQGEATCVNVFYRGGDAIEETIWALPPDVQETWYALSFSAVVAEVRGTPPLRQPDPNSIEALTEIVGQEKAKRDYRPVLGASSTQEARIDCLKAQRIYAGVVGDVQRRPGLDRALVARMPNPAGALP